MVNATIMRLLSNFDNFAPVSDGTGNDFAGFAKFGKMQRKNDSKLARMSLASLLAVKDMINNQAEDDRVTTLEEMDEFIDRARKKAKSKPVVQKKNLNVPLDFGPQRVKSTKRPTLKAPPAVRPRIKDLKKDPKYNPNGIIRTGVGKNLMGPRLKRPRKEAPARPRISNVNHSRAVRGIKVPPLARASSAYTASRGGAAQAPPKAPMAMTAALRKAVRAPASRAPAGRTRVAGRKRLMKRSTTAKVRKPTHRHPGKSNKDGGPNMSDPVNKAYAKRNGMSYGKQLCK